MKPGEVHTAHSSQLTAHKPILERFRRWVITPLTIVFGSLALIAGVLFAILAVKLG